MLAQLGLAVVIGLAVGLAISWSVAASRTRRNRRLALQVSESIEPYLRRRAAEVGVDPERPVWTARHSPEERIDYASSLAQKLLQEARGVDLGHSNTALAQTARALDSGAVTAPRERPAGTSDDHQSNRIEK